MRLKILSTDLVESLINESVPDNIAKMIANVLGQKHIFNPQRLYEFQDSIASELSSELGVSNDEAMHEIDQYLVDSGKEPWFGTVEKPQAAAPTPIKPPIKTRDPNRPKITRSANEHEWEAEWHDTLDNAFKTLNNFRPSDLWGRGISEYFPDSKYFAFDVGGDDGWLTLASPQTRTSNDREIGGRGMYILRKVADKDIPRLQIRAGEKVKDWLPKVIDYMNEEDVPTDWDSPRWKTFLRNILLKTGLGLQTNRQERRNDRVTAAFDPEYATSFDQLREVWGPDTRLESRIPGRLALLIDAVSIARRLRRAAMH